MELLVGEMVLDARPADERDAAIDDDDLAVVEMAEVVEAPVDPAASDRTVEVQERALVGNDLDAARNQVPVQAPRPEPRLRVDAVHHEADRDSLAHLGDQSIAETRPDLARAVAEDEDVDVRLRGLDIGQDARKERWTVDQQFPVRCDGRRKVDCERPPLRASLEHCLNERPGSGRGDGRSAAAKSLGARPDRQRRAPASPRAIAAIGRTRLITMRP